MINKTASITLHVTADCEGCGHRYDWKVTLTKKTSSALYGYARDPTPGLMKQATKTIAEFRYGLRRCPGCGYLQSWMRKQWEERNTNVAIGLSIPLFIALGYCVGWPWPQRTLTDVSDLIAFGGALLGYFLMFAIVSMPFQIGAQRLSSKTDPNKKWHSTHGSEIPPVRLPYVEPVPTTSAGTRLFPGV